jgi:hypothetical protein
MSGVSIGRFMTDATKELNGTWVDMGAGLMLKIARINNERYQEFIREKGKPFGHAIRAGVAQVDMDDIVHEGVAKYVLLEWKDLLDEDGVTPIPYSPEKAVELFKKAPDFLDIVVKMASNMDLFRKEAQKEAAKNS